MPAKYRISTLGLLMMLVQPLTGCANQETKTEIPSFPHPKPAVAVEFQAVCFTNDNPPVLICPATQEWYSRLHQLDDKLKAAQ